MSKTKLPPKENGNDKAVAIYNLVLHNDDLNTFDFVIETLINICNHEFIQAVQCAHLVHNTGKCSVKRGTFEVLKPKCEAIIEKGLSASIE